MRRRELTRRCCVRGAGGAAAVLALLLVSGAWAEPGGHHTAAAPDGYPPDCPGRLHRQQRASNTPPPLERFFVPPYGFLWGYPVLEFPAAAPALVPPPDYRADVFHIVDCPQDPVGDHFPGLDLLITQMGHEGLKFYQSSTETLESGPDGLFAADDVVIIKINYQWSERGGTNTDVLRGLIRRLVDHPDVFTGEIVVCENAQFASTSGFDRPNNNAQDTGLSPHDVVVHFQTLGYTISHYDWTALRYVSVGEYSEGDFDDGYIVYDYDGQLNGRISYPKFKTDHGTSISTRFGLWEPLDGGYDRARLKFINVPVLKSHHSTYGVTACVKNYMGVVTGALSTNSHSAIRYGLLGALLGEIQPADLNILDCIWINANPYSGPATSYAGATRRDELVASVDPVAADLWAAKHILIPAFIDNGYSPPWPYPSADPDDPTSEFREYLDNSMSYILAAGYNATNDESQIDTVTWSGGPDADGDGDPNEADNCPWDPNPDQADYDHDGIGDACECVGDADGSGTVDATDFLALLAAWGPCTACPEDFDQSGDVGITDFLALVGNWGSCY